MNSILIFENAGMPFFVSLGYFGSIFMKNFDIHEIPKESHWYTHKKIKETEKLKEN